MLSRFRLEIYYLSVFMTLMDMIQCVFQPFEKKSALEMEKRSPKCQLYLRNSCRQSEHGGEVWRKIV